MLLIATIMLLPVHHGFNVHSWSRPNASFTDERRLPTRGDDRTALCLRGSRMEASSHSSGASIHAFAGGTHDLPEGLGKYATPGKPSKSSSCVQTTPPTAWAVA